MTGEWRGDTGGNRQMGTWVNNPKIKLSWNEKTKASGYVEIFVGLYIRDSRLKLGFDFFKVLALVFYFVVYALFCIVLLLGANESHPC